MKPLSLYIHIPFCARKCQYCDFTSFSCTQADIESYFPALHREISAWQKRLDGHEIQTVFFGGGTPSLVPAEYISDTLMRLRENFRIAKNAEITLEANPGTLDDKKLESYLQSGVNRLSIGVQSFDAGLLSLLGRIHTPDEAVQAVKSAQKAGFENINLDLMYALPRQTHNQWMDTLSQAVGLSPTHLSCYSLILEENTPITRRVERGELPPADEDITLEMQRACTSFLAKNGYGRYEISNYAKDSFTCRHNLVYWNRGEYLGLGMAAHSFFGGLRFFETDDFGQYIGGAPVRCEEAMDMQEAEEECIMLATRTCRGIDLKKFEADFGKSFFHGREKRIDRLINHGLARTENGFFFLTEAGMEVQSAVVIDLLGE